jgi:RNA polymerase-binding transcription factor DksA
MEKLDTKQFKEKLEKEFERLTGELKTVGRINPSNPADWEARPTEMDIQEADRNEAGDRIEEYETNTGILKELETRYNNVKRALKKIEDGTYGYCEVSGEQIERERLEANPAARTCLKHIDTEQK